MPRRQHRGKRRRQSSDWLAGYLTKGELPPRGTPGYNAYWHFLDTNVRAAWTEHRDRILPRFIEQHPGYRPWAWWRFESDEGAAPEDETAYLAEHDLLSLAEREAMEETTCN